MLFGGFKLHKENNYLHVQKSVLGIFYNMLIKIWQINRS